MYRKLQRVSVLKRSETLRILYTRAVFSFEIPIWSAESTFGGNRAIYCRWVPTFLLPFKRLGISSASICQ